MISPHTPPGTALVVVWIAKSADDILSLCPAEYHGQLMLMMGAHGFGKPFTFGQRVVLAAIEPTPASLDGFGARVVGVVGLYPLKAFRVAELPRSITSLLATKPADQLEDA